MLLLPSRCFPHAENPRFEPRFHIPAAFYLDSMARDRKYILAGSEDGRILFWNLQTRQMEIFLEAGGGECQPGQGKSERTRSLISYTPWSNWIIDTW